MGRQMRFRCIDFIEVINKERLYFFWAKTYVLTWFGVFSVFFHGCRQNQIYKTAGSEPLRKVIAEAFEPASAVGKYQMVWE